jgi:uncharacterized repeat protein (TIGR02543 family)
LYYKRNQYTLKVWNYNVTLNTIENIKYGESLSAYKPTSTPAYPSGLEKNKYEFVGWYTDDTYDTPFNWDTATMPDSDLVVYAYWKPKTYTVNFYSDEVSVGVKNPVYTAKADYGTFIQSVDEILTENLDAPQYTVNGQTYEATAVGWFYYDSSGTKHAFDLETMTVSDDMDLFMAWTTNVPTFFKVNYVTSDGTTIADSTTGSSFVGLTRTFTAKTGTSLYDGYQQHYFPDRASTSILMKLETSQNTLTNNVATFKYYYMEYLPYTVQYVDVDTNAVLGTETHEYNTSAVVTEKYKSFKNYVPTSYYQTLTLTVDEDGNPDTEHNVITFYYKRNTQIMLCHVRYLREDESGTYTYNDMTFLGDDSGSIDSNETVGTSKDINIVSYTGYTVSAYSITNYDVQGNESASSSGNLNATDTTLKVSLEESGVYVKDIYVYYTRNTYPVKVSYTLNTKADSTDSSYIKEWNDALKSSEELKGVTLTPVGSAITYQGAKYYTEYYQVVDSQKYDTTYETKTPTLNGFSLIDNKYTKSIIVKIDDTNFSSNSIQFTYNPIDSVLFSYEAKYFDGTKSSTSTPLSSNQESVYIGTRPKSVTADLNFENYKFEGWYTNEDCTQSVKGGEVTTGSTNVLTPLSNNVDTTYYAKYVYQCGDLTITNTSEVAQSFEYVVTGIGSNNSTITVKVCIDGQGSKTITGLPVGDYTVTQTTWSWRYSASTENSTVELTTSGAEVKFSQSMVNTKWLDGNAYLDMTPTK